MQKQSSAQSHHFIARLVCLVLVLITFSVPCMAAQKKAANNTKKITFKQVQERLSSKGYLSKNAVTGSSNGATSKAVRIFKMVNGLSVNSTLNKATVKKLFSSGARTKPTINNKSWSSSGISSVFRKRSLATLVDLATGTRIRIRRVGGHNHLDVEPKTASDTARLKKVYGGTFSWDSRPVLLIAGGKYYAAAMNSMPHGAEISKSNNFNGQFCVHLNGCITHGSEQSNPYHQSNVKKAYEYLT